MSREYSAIDTIYLLLEKIEEQGQIIEIMNQNIKELNNKIYILNNRINKIQTEQKTFKAEASEKITQRSVVPNSESSELILGKVKVYGYIVNGSKHPIHGVSVDLFKNNKVIRNMKTDKDGYWEARLPAGSYTVKYSHKKFKDVFKEISFQEDLSQYEVK